MSRRRMHLPVLGMPVQQIQYQVLQRRGQDLVHQSQQFLPHLLRIIFAGGVQERGIKIFEFPFDRAYLFHGKNSLNFKFKCSPESSYLTHGTDIISYLKRSRTFLQNIGPEIGWY